MAAVKEIKWTRNLVNTFWDGFARTRLTELSFSSLAGPECVHVFSSFLDKSNLYLDFGGGDGHLADLLCAAGYKVAVYDPSGDRTQLAVRRLSKHQTFVGVVDESTELRFDGIFLIEVAEHVLDEEIAGTYGTIHRLLSNGGLLFLTTPNQEDLSLGSCYEPTNGLFFHRWQHVRSFNRDSLAQMLAPFDLAEVVIHELEFRRDVIDAVKQMVKDRNIIDPFASRRPVILGGRSNLAAVFAKGKAKFATFSEPYIVNTAVLAEAPDEVSMNDKMTSFLDLSPDLIWCDSGNCFLYSLPQICQADGMDGGTRSPLRLYEDGNRLGPPHSLHEDIRREGKGVFSHWAGGTLFFSSSDNSDPRKNGRVYRVSVSSAMS